MLLSVLAAVLILSGDVKTVNGLPIPAATVEWNGSERTVSDAAGHFTVVPAGSWPADLTVSARGFGTVVVPVPHARRTTRLPPITLAPTGQAMPPARFAPQQANRPALRGMVVPEARLSAQ